MILSYHVVALKLHASAIAALIKEGNGTATLKKVSGGTIKAAMKGKKLVLTAEKDEFLITFVVRSVYEKNYYYP